MKKPLYFTMPQIASVLSSDDDPWDTQRARRWAKATGAGRKMGGRWKVSRATLLSAFPEMLSALNDKHWN